MPDDPVADPREPLVPRGPVETLAPSRTAIVLVALVGLVVAVLVGVGALTLETSTLGEGERRLVEGRHELVAGPVTLTAALPGDWVARTRCPRWLQLSSADGDANTLHVVWLDAVPAASGAEDVVLVDAPDDLPTWWRDDLGLRLTALGEGHLDGHAFERWRLDATKASRRSDALVACGDVGGPAATGMFGPAARFDQQVALVNVDGTILMLVAAAYSGGDPAIAGDALESVLSTGTLEVAGD